MRGFAFIFGLIVSFTLALTSCQTELEPNPDPPAQGSLQDSLGSCYPSLLAGIYQANSALNSTHYIDAGVFFNSVGTYEIATDTINGFHFRGLGTALATGFQIVHLDGQGTPLDTGAYVFQMRFGSSLCDISVVVGDDNAPSAIFTLSGNGGSCSGTVLSGTYTAGAAMTSANTATLAVTVSSPGTFSITTPTINGVYFTGAGTLTTASNSITLAAIGTPTASATNTTSTYPVVTGSSSCSFNVVYTGVPVGPGQFTFDCSTMPAAFPLVGPRLRVGQTLNPDVDTISVEVNVLFPGSYTINTAYGLGGADGVNFNATGVFTTTGVQRLRLGANGTPARGGIVFYNISSPQATNTNPCSTSAYYEFLYSNVNGSGPRNFTFFSSVVNDNTTLAGYDLIRWKGFSSSPTGEYVELTIGLPSGSSFNTTSDVIYTINDFPGKYVKAVYTDAGNPSIQYIAETNGSMQTNPLSITITFCTAGRIEGNYSGVVLDNGGAGPGTRTISGTFGLWRL